MRFKIPVNNDDVCMLCRGSEGVGQILTRPWAVDSANNGEFIECICQIFSPEIVGLPDGLGGLVNLDISFRRQVDCRFWLIVLRGTNGFRYYELRRLNLRLN